MNDNLNIKIRNYEAISKDFFYLDIDSLDYLKLLKIYAHILAYNYDNIIQVERELKFNDLVRIHTSSSKKGFHIRVNMKNNLIENLHYRSIWGDDVHRIQNDLIRLNHESLSYDVIFSTKKKKDIVKQKEYKHINPLALVGISEKEFFLLICAIKDNKLNKMSDILDKYKEKFKKKDLSKNHKDNMDRLLSKYCRETQTGELIVENRENLVKALYFYSINNLPNKSLFSFFRKK